VVADGILTYDSNDPQSYDYFEYHRPGALDPGPNQIFICQWKLWTEWVTYYGDPDVSIKSDDAWAVTLVFDVDVIHSLHEYVDIPIPRGGWHDYMLASADMRTYELYADQTLLWQGSFAHRFIASSVNWGDCGQGAASTHHWDYFRLGVLPLPQTGDVNCDGTVSFADINPFVLALVDGEAYKRAYPSCWPQNADINDDGSVDFGDINPFVALLTS
jgi:hypothetical protein